VMDRDVAPFVDVPWAGRVVSFPAIPLMGFLPNAGVGKDVGSCATHMDAVGCHLPFSERVLTFLT
jgi:hypothetical protein